MFPGMTDEDVDREIELAAEASVSSSSKKVPNRGRAPTNFRGPGTEASAAYLSLRRMLGNRAAQASELVWSAYHILFGT